MRAPRFCGQAGGRPVSRTCSTRVMGCATCLVVPSPRGAARRDCQVASGDRVSATGDATGMTRQQEARQLLARLSELAQDETLSDEDATEMVAGLVGALERMRDNPAWQRVMAKAGTRSSKWPRWITARSSPPQNPDTPKPEMPLIMRALPTGDARPSRAGAASPCHPMCRRWREVAARRTDKIAPSITMPCGTEAPNGPKPWRGR
jgi:hypothetical protein